MLFKTGRITTTSRPAARGGAAAAGRGAGAAARSAAGPGCRTSSRQVCCAPVPYSALELFYDVIFIC